MLIHPDRFLRALSDPTRMRILALLEAERELCVCELRGAMQMAQPKVSRHLAVLRKAGIQIRLEKVTGIAEIMRFGVLSTPGVVVDGRLVHAGGLPGPDDARAWVADSSDG